MNKYMLFIILGFLTGCSSVVKNFDSSEFDHRSRFEKAETLPPLEISPQLIQVAIPETY